MLKLVLGALGLVETLYPAQYMRVLTRLAYDYEGDPPTAKPWVVKIAQLEGVLLLGAVVWSTLKADWSCSLRRSDGDDAGSDDSDSTESDNSDSTDTEADRDDIAE